MIGVISDTHDNVLNIKKAVELFKQNNVSFVIHLGDIVAPATVKFFSGLKMKFIIGNCDGDVEMLKKRIEEINSEFLGRIAELEVEGKKIAAYHGNNAEILSKLIQSNKYDYVLHGHTHQTRDEVIGNTRVINPGAHYFMGENTVVLLDVENNEVKFVKLK